MLPLRLKPIAYRLAAAVLFVASSAFAAAGSTLSRDEMLADVKNAAGLCVHVGSTDGAIEMAAAQSGRMLVHGLARDEAALASARDAVEKAGRYGLASIALHLADNLPYRDCLIDRLIVTAPAIGDDEAMRAVAPGGVAYLRSGGDAFRRVVKARPPTMGDWPTRMNESQGSLVSRDSALKAPFELRWMDGTTLGSYAVNATLSSAQGRYFACTVWDAANIGLARQDTVLVARNAFNGLPLWRRMSGDQASRHGVCAVGNVVVVAGSGRTREVISLDAATGAQLCAIPLGTSELLGWGPAGDTIVMAANPPRKATTLPTQLLCHDARTGEKRWASDRGSWPLLISGDTIFTAADKIVAVDVKTGAVRWEAAPPPLGEATLWGPARLVLCYVESGTLVVATTSHLAAYAIADGGPRWSLDLRHISAKDKPVNRPGPYPWQGQVALGKKLYDLATGKEQGDAPPPFGGRCMPRVVCVNYTIGIGPARDLGLLGEGDLTKMVRFAGMDSICSIGLMVANGMMYSGPSFCSCVKGKIEGFPAFGAAGVRIAEADVIAPRPVVAGKGGQRPFDTAAASTDWPVYRHDLQRSAATTARAPAKLNIRWDRPLSRLPEGLIADAWKSRISIGLTAVTSSGGRVFIADAETHRVIALSARDGQTLWSFRAGARIDTPPTIHQGRCLFGSRDGWVYCLRADDGALVWRTRAAPGEQYVIAYGQVESAWPVHGSVAVQDDVVLLSAGRSHGVDGGLPFLALRLADGSTAWARNRGYIADVPISDGTSLYIGGMKVVNEDLPRDIKGKITGAVAQTLLLNSKAHAEIPLLIGPRPGLADAGLMIQPPWQGHGGQIRSHAWFYRGRKGAVLAFDNSAVYAAAIAEWFEKKSKDGTVVHLAGYHQQPDKTDPLWSVKLPAGQRVNGLAVTADALIVCGASNIATPDMRGFVRTLAKDTGATIAEQTFAGMSNWDPMAVVDGMIYLSTADGRLICVGE
jgi:outer membrane protein assembly factor BamB